MCVFGSVKQKESVAVVVLGSNSVWKIYWVAAVKKQAVNTSRVTAGWFCSLLFLRSKKDYTLELHRSTPGCQVALIKSPNM